MWEGYQVNHNQGVIMDRRQFIIRSSLLAAGAALPIRRAAARAQGEFTEIRRNVGYFTERGGTIGWLAAPGALAVVDSQFPETARNCLNGLQDRTDHPLDLLVNTHHHGDHTAGNTEFEGVAEQIVAHENVPGLMKKAAEENDSGEQAYPDTTYDARWEADFGDETIHVAHYGPAHTGGDSVIYFEKANVVHMGDLVFNRMNPYTDHPSGASILNWIRVLETVEDEYPADAEYIFGHSKPEAGVTGSKDDVAVMRDYLSAMVEYVEKSIERGIERDAIINREELEGFEDFLYADFWTLTDNLKIVYAEVTS